MEGDILPRFRIGYNKDLCLRSWKCGDLGGIVGEIVPECGKETAVDRFDCTNLDACQSVIDPSLRIVAMLTQMVGCAEKSDPGMEKRS
jgi:hypothetical protein